jgi:hypothetical protein
LEQIEFPVPEHLAFDELEFGDLALGLTVDQGSVMAVPTA